MKGSSSTATLENLIPSLSHTFRALKETSSSPRARSLSPTKRVIKAKNEKICKNLYAANLVFKITPELNPTHSLPRWPSECQILLNRVKHIRSTPTEPELFYELTKLEPQPRPIGEEHGVLAYEYQHKSPVNYFMNE